MNNNIKLLFIVAIILLVITGIVLFFAFRQSPLGSGASGGVVGGGGDLPGDNNIVNNDRIIKTPTGTITLAKPASEDEKKKLVQLSPDPALGATINKDGNRVMFFKRGTGNLFETTLDGNGGETRLSNLTIKNIFEAKWSQSKTYAAITSINSSDVSNFWLHLTGTSTIQTGEFENKLLSFVFSPAEEKLASFVKAGSQYSVSTSNPDGKNTKTIHSTQIPDFEIYWPSKTTLALKTKSSAFAPSLLETLSISGGSPKVIASGEMSFDIIWAPDGIHYLAMSTQNKGQNLKLSIRSLTASEKPIDTSFKTLPEKCVFSKKEKLTLFCAIPNTLGPNPLPDAWWQGKTQFQDQLWSLNASTGELKLLLQGGGFDITNLFTSPNENYIFFINKKDSTLWSLRLI